MTIYFIKAGDSVAYKIGFTAGDPLKRMMELQVGCPLTLTLIGSVEGERAHESFLHEKFSHLRMSGEWFSPAEELNDSIDEILRPDFQWGALMRDWLPPSTGAIERAIALAGSEAKLAVGTGYSQVAINKAKKRGQVSAEMALAIHRRLAGGVCAFDLRPDIWATHDDAMRAAALLAA